MLESEFYLQIFLKHHLIISNHLVLVAEELNQVDF